MLYAGRLLGIDGALAMLDVKVMYGIALISARINVMIGALVT